MGKHLSAMALGLIVLFALAAAVVYAPVVVTWLAKIGFLLAFAWLVGHAVMVLYSLFTK